MISATTYLVIDAGNTRIKAAIFKGAELQEVRVFDRTQREEFSIFLRAFQKTPAIISSVLSEADNGWLKSELTGALWFDQQTPHPLNMGYDTPETLGVDRLANAIACNNLCKGSALAIDLGTCIKYDFVDQNGTYQGGAISPGIELRYQAMHQFTGKLPLVKDRQIPQTIGKNTLDAMRSGVMNGILEEIKGFIERYRAEYPDLTIFLTGGDHQYFDIGLKNGIFADENLTLKGLQIVLVHALA
jgi:type III pantothenate kinase